MLFIFLCFRCLKASSHLKNLKRLWITGGCFSPCISGSCDQFFLHSSFLQSCCCFFTDGLLDMTSGGNVSSLQRGSLTREVDSGTACPTCRRSCAPAPLNVTCLCPSSAGRPTRYLPKCWICTVITALRHYNWLCLHPYLASVFLSGCIRSQRLLCPQPVL